DDLRSGNCTARTGSAGRVGQTRRILSGLIGDEFVEIGVGEHLAWALSAMTDADVFERAGGDVAVERLDRTTELGSGLRGGLEPVRWRGARLARGFGGLRGVQIRTGSGAVFARDNFVDLAVQRLRRVPLAPKRFKQPGFAGGAGVIFFVIGELGRAPPSCGVLIKPRPAVRQRWVGALIYSATVVFLQARTARASPSEAKFHSKRRERLWDGWIAPRDGSIGRPI